MTRVFEMRLDAIQPSQLFINAAKLEQVTGVPTEPEPIPVKRLGGRVIFTDGHTRAFAAHRRGETEIAVFWDEDELDWEAYETCVRWCEEAGIHRIGDLEGRILPPDEYEERWIRRCERMREGS